MSAKGKSAKGITTCPGPYDCEVDNERLLYLQSDTKPPWTPPRITSTGSKRSRQWRGNVRRRYALSTDGEHIMAINNPKQTSGRPGFVHPLKTATVVFAQRLLPHPGEEQEILHRAHEFHDGVDRMVASIGKQYKIANLQRKCEAIRRVCTRCNEHEIGPQQASTAIITTHPDEIHVIDCCSMPFRDGRGRKHFVLIRDHFTKYMAGAALKHKDAQSVLAFLRFLYTVGGWALPRDWLSDNGREFVNRLITALVVEFTPIGVRHGAARCPKSQGLIENGNKVVKRKTIQGCQDQGMVAKGRSAGKQKHKWVPVFHRVVDATNNAPHKTYGNHVTPFLARFHRPRMRADCNTMGPADIADLHEKMVECQISRGQKAGKKIEFLHFMCGDIVNVRAQKAHLKNGRCFALWSPTAVVHDSTEADFYTLRWLTVGLSGEQVGQLSTRMYYASRLKHVLPVREASVYDARAGGFLVTKTCSATGDVEGVCIDDGDHYLNPAKYSKSQLKLLVHHTYSAYVGVDRQDCLTPHSDDSDDSVSSKPDTASDAGSDSQYSSDDEREHYEDIDPCNYGN